MIRRLLAVLAVLLSGVLLLSALGPDPPAAEDRDRGCPSAFPHRMSGDPDGRLFPRAVAELRICADPAGTTTLIANGTQAVWTLLGPEHVALQRNSGNSLTSSFLHFVRSSSPVVPPGSVVALARPPSELRAVIDPLLTVAKLTHDELAASLAAQSPLLLDATVRSALAGNRTALTRCLEEVLDRVADVAEALLVSGNPAPRITRAAEDVAADEDGCAEAWRQAKLSAGIPSAQASSFAADVAAWRRDQRFIIRAVSASIAYLALTQGTSG